MFYFLPVSMNSCEIWSYVLNVPWVNVRDTEESTAKRLVWLSTCRLQVQASKATWKSHGFRITKKCLLKEQELPHSCPTVSNVITLMSTAKWSWAWSGRRASLTTHLYLRSRLIFGLLACPGQALKVGCLNICRSMQMASSIDTESSGNIC
jgi:hypothetical protein